MKRRDFLLRGTLLTAGAGAGLSIDFAELLGKPTRRSRPLTDAFSKELALRALDAARRAGASYADVRINRNRNQGVATRERQIAGLSDNETEGFGVRVIAGGSWGFACSLTLSAEEVDRVAAVAVAQARANAAGRARPLELAPVQAYPEAVWRSPVRVDPFDIPIEQKVELLLAANEAALGVAGARFVTSSMFFLREDKLFASTEGTFSDQTLYRASVGMNGPFPFARCPPAGRKGRINARS